MSVITVKNLTDLREVLEKHGVPVDSYGQGKAKTLEHLLKEVYGGECVLEAAEDGTVIRKTSVVCLYICCGEFVLREKYQVLPRSSSDWRGRSRSIDASAGEKLKAGEQPLVALGRLIKEEFPFLIGRPVTELPLKVEVAESESYPGISTKYAKYFYKVELPELVFGLVIVKETGHSGHVSSVANLTVPRLMVDEGDKVVFYEWVTEQVE